ncbi:MAG: hypothetical protein KI792_12990 [Alphaproteobacteria bacterium]|nr:hypothetical protein [Alphaproteobacteria bacterium SS10]
MAQSLLVVIVEKDFFLDVCEALEASSITAFTCLHGTGTGIWQQVDRWVNPEKIVFMSVINKSQQEAAYDSLRKRVSLDMPGRGIAFSMPVESGIGVGIPADGTSAAADA